MNEINKQPEATVTARPRNSYRFKTYSRDEKQIFVRYTMFILATLAFVGGGWALFCLGKTLFTEGPLNLLMSLKSAITGN